VKLSTQLQYVDLGRNTCNGLVEDFDEVLKTLPDSHKKPCWGLKWCFRSFEALKPTGVSEEDAASVFNVYVLLIGSYRFLAGLISGS
jgi:hypothetical protein